VTVVAVGGDAGAAAPAASGLRPTPPDCPGFLGRLGRFNDISIAAVAASENKNARLESTVASSGGDPCWETISPRSLEPLSEWCAAGKKKRHFLLASKPRKMVTKIKRGETGQKIKFVPHWSLL
jgi:hypothetical protein